MHQMNHAGRGQTQVISILVTKYCHEITTMNLLNRVFKFGSSPAPSTPTKTTIVAKDQQGTVYASFPQEGPLLETTTPNDTQREFVCYHDAMTERQEIVLVVRGFFSLAECERITEQSEELGLEDLSHIYSADYRNNTRVMVSSHEYNTRLTFHCLTNSFLLSSY